MEFENATISDDFLTNPENPYQKQKVSGKMSLIMRFYTERNIKVENMENAGYRIWRGSMLAVGLAVAAAAAAPMAVYAAPRSVTAYAVVGNDRMIRNGITGVEMPGAGLLNRTTGVQEMPGGGQQVPGVVQSASGGTPEAPGAVQPVSGGTPEAPGVVQPVSGGTPVSPAETQPASGLTSTGTVTAGQTQPQNPGPSTYGTIVTEGEKSAPPQDAILGGATLTMLKSQSESQMLSVLLETSQGSLIVVDGGLGADAAYLRSQIQARGGHVAAWLITHPHGDHAGALYQILQDEAAGQASGITIDGIYYSFAAPEWYTVHDPAEVTMAHSIIGTFAGLPQTMLHQVSRGQTIQVDDVTIQVMNDRYELGSSKGNNAGIVYKAYVNGRSILFLGDMAEEGGNRLLAEAGPEALKSDIVQMAHHGQNGVSEAVYQAIRPSICLWPTPQWLWDNAGARYTIPATKTWMGRLGVQLHYCTKDGDQVIR